MTNWANKNPFGEDKGVQKKEEGESTNQSNTIYIKQDHKCQDLKKLKYVEVEKNDKKPKWNNYNVPNDPNQLSLDDVKHNQIGVLTGYEGLVIIDIDHPDIVDDLCRVLPDTLTVKTGNPKEYKKHYYYWSPNEPITFRLINKEIEGEKPDRLVDVLGLRKNGKYAMSLAPGAIHPDSGNQYRIINDRDIHQLTNDEWLRIKDVLDRYDETPKKQNTIHKPASNNGNDIFEYIKQNIDLEMYLACHGINFNSHDKARCPIHGDNKTPSLHNYGDYCFCYGCDKRYTIIDFILHFEQIELKDIPNWFKSNYPDEFAEYDNQNEQFEKNKKTEDKKEVEKDVKTEDKVHWPKIYDWSEIVNMDIPEPTWFVKGLIPEGVTLISGKAKVGKSYFASNIVVDVIQGGLVLGNFESNKTEVFFLALEDSLRRMKKRGQELIQDMPKGCHMTTEWEIGTKGVDMVRQYVSKNPNIGMVVIDTLAMVRDDGKKTKTLYQMDYDSLKHWRKLSQDLSISIIVVTHSRKIEGAIDPFDEVSGSTGLTGACDTVMVLKPYSKSNIDASLYVRGNDVEQQEFALSFKDKRWLYEGTAEEYVGSDIENQVLECFDDDEIITASDISEKMDKSYDYSKKIIKRLVKKELITKISRGKYQRR